jgi:hypothetical protein
MAADEGDILARRSAIIIGRHHSVAVTTCRVQKITLCDRYSISSSADPWTRGVVGRYHDIIQMMSTSICGGGCDGIPGTSSSISATKRDECASARQATRFECG